MMPSAGAAARTVPPSLPCPLPLAHPAHAWAAPWLVWPLAYLSPDSAGQRPRQPASQTVPAATCSCRNRLMELGRLMRRAAFAAGQSSFSEDVLQHPPVNRLSPRAESPSARPCLARLSLRLGLQPPSLSVITLKSARRCSGVMHGWSAMSEPGGAASVRPAMGGGMVAGGRAAAAGGCAAARSRRG